MDRKFKQSKVEKRVNYYILYIIIAQFFMCLIGAVGISIWANQSWDDHKYLGD